MSSPIHHAQDLDAALTDAPPWLRSRGRRGAQRPAPISPTAAPPIQASPGRWRRRTAGAFSGDLAMAKLQRQLALHPDEVPAPPFDDHQSV